MKITGKRAEAFRRSLPEEEHIKAFGCKFEDIEPVTQEDIDRFNNHVKDYPPLIEVMMATYH